MILDKIRALEYSYVCILMYSRIISPSNRSGLIESWFSDAFRVMKIWLMN